MSRDFDGPEPTLKQIIALMVTVAAIVAALVTFANWRDMGDGTPRTPSPKPAVSAQGELCHGAWDSQCWETQDDGPWSTANPITGWRTTPRAPSPTPKG